ncbi:galactose oxidase [Gigaspora margarita]|uniref:Galactose oxidase n=1 Tax=Gigaspora margarita TaxID=4874 RepID=A0A8H3X7P4_GIGMA|nr:galactose oxidase [Gigaspora margarita]
MNNFQNLCIYFILIFNYSFITSQNIPDADMNIQVILLMTNFIFFGGATDTTNPSNEEFYIDLSNRFDIFTPPFKKVSIGMPVGENLGTRVSSPDNSTTFLIGGRMTSTSTAINSVIDSKGQTYIFGGTDSKTRTYTSNGNWFYEMSIFDTTSMTWSTLPLLTDVLPRLDFTATLLSTGLIIYIGEYVYLLIYFMNNNHIMYILILIFDTKSLSWSNKTASGITIQSRYGHSAILTKDGDIVIFSGASVSAQVSCRFKYKYLDIVFQVIPRSKNKSSNRKTYCHSNNIYIFNTATYSLVSSFNEVSQGITDNGYNSTYKIILCVVISIVCIAFLSSPCRVL